jgi:dolichol-phosphate mannosyltransferase
MPSLSVIIPAYNEERNIVAAIEEVLQEVAATVPDVEIIVVDDGSRDRTAGLVAELAARAPQITMLRQENRGHGAALMHGLGKATGEWILLIDSDRQVSLAHFRQHWEMTARHDVILGVRRPRHDPVHRQLISLLMRMLLKARLGVGLSDAGVPYKLFRIGLWQDARRAMREGCWIPSVLIAAQAMRRPDLSVVEIPVEHRPRSHGNSTLNLRRLVRFCREGVADISYFRGHSNADAGRDR